MEANDPARRAKTIALAEMERALTAPTRERGWRLRRLVRLLAERCCDPEGLAGELLALSADELPDAG